MKQGFKRGIAGASFWIALLLSPVVVSATVYYVDPGIGSDSNAGTDQGAPWKNIPGTYRTDNGGFVEAPGWVKIKAGDTVAIKSGSAFGSRVTIDGNWYDNGTADSRIWIVRDQGWGTGPVIFDGGGQQLGTWDAVVSVMKVSYVTMDGGTPGGFIIKNSRARGFVGYGNSESEKMGGLTFRNALMTGQTGLSVVLQNQDSFLIENVEVDGKGYVGTGGFYIGDQRYGCSNGRLRNCLSHHNGANPGRQEGGTDIQIGFWCTNSTNIVFESCVSHDNEGDGFDLGVVGWPPSTVTDNIVYLNCLTYNNADGFGCNLDDIAGEAKVWYLNCITHDNNTGWNVYKGPTASIFNCVSARNGSGVYIDTADFARPTSVTLKNNIFYGNKNNTVYAHDCQTLQYSADYNLYDRGNGANSVVRWYDAPGGESQFGEYLFDGSKNLAQWIETHSQDSHSAGSGEGRYAHFVQPDSNDYHLSNDSAALSSGADLSGEWPSWLTTADVNGSPRPSGGVWDIGPYAK